MPVASVDIRDHVPTDNSDDGAYSLCITFDAFDDKYEIVLRINTKQRK